MQQTALLLYFSLMHTVMDTTEKMCRGTAQSGNSKAERAHGWDRIQRASLFKVGLHRSIMCDWGKVGQAGASILITDAISSQLLTF